METATLSDFSRNFRELQKHAKRPYSLRKVIRELSDKPGISPTESTDLPGLRHEVLRHRR